MAILKIHANFVSQKDEFSPQKLTMQAQALRNKKGRTYYLLGRLVLMREPDVAERLLLDYNSRNVVPAERDYERIGEYFTRFHSHDPEHSKARLDEMRLFIAAMLHLYQPQVYHGLALRAKGSGSFVSALGAVIARCKSQTSRLIAEAIVFEKVYDDFRQSVTGVLDQISKPDLCQVDHTINPVK